MAINLVVNVFLLPWLMFRFNKSVLDEGGSELEMYFILGYIFIKLGSMYHNVYCLGPTKEQFNVNVSTSIDYMINLKKSRLQFNEIKELEDGGLQNTIQKAKWQMICFVEILLSTFISLFSFCGNFIWLFNISPLSVVVYTLVIGVSITLISFKEIDYQKNFELWDRSWFLENDLFTMMIHGKGKDSVKEIVKCQKQIEEKQYTERIDRSIHSNTLNSIFWVIFAIYVPVFRVFEKFSKLDSIQYVAYTMGIGGYTESFSNIYRHYKEAKKEWDELDRILFQLAERKKVPQVRVTKRLKLRGTFHHNTSGTKKPFTLNFEKPITIKTDQIIRLEGKSGHGKSTFLNILSGIIPWHDVKNSLCKVDGYRVSDGCAALMESRVYAQQKMNTPMKPCVYEIVSGLQPSSTPDPEIEKMVWQALQMAECSDFLGDPKQASKDKKSIYTKNICPSGGQEVRIGVAKILFFLFQMKPSILILDEIDRAIPGEMATTIMDNIFKYCRQNTICCIAVAHTTEVKQMKFDSVITCLNGKVTQKS